VQGFAGDSGGYELTLAPADGGTAPAGTPGAGGGGAAAVPAPAAGAVADLGALRDVLEASETVEAQTLWFGFAVAEGGSFGLQGLSLGGPLVMQLTDAAGAVLGSAEAGGGFDIALLEASLAPGSYRVALHWPAGGGRAAVRQLVVTRR
jgi:hypothetical protein